MDKVKSCKYACVLSGSIDGNTLYDIYVVGRKPAISSGWHPNKANIISDIQVYHLSYTVAAVIIYDNNEKEYVEQVKRYI